MTDNIYLQLGVGGIFAILVIRVVLDALPKLSRKDGNGKASRSGDLDPAFWQMEFRAAVREGIDTSPTMARQTEILSAIKELQRELVQEVRDARHQR